MTGNHVFSFGVSNVADNVEQNIGVYLRRCHTVSISDGDVMIKWVEKRRVYGGNVTLGSINGLTMFEIEYNGIDGSHEGKAYRMVCNYDFTGKIVYYDDELELLYKKAEDIISYMLDILGSDKKDS